MAVGSEKFTWKLFGHPRRQCLRCGLEPLRIEDVGLHRRLYPGGKNEFLCKECQRKDVERMIEENRRGLGLQDTQAHPGPASAP